MSDIDREQVLDFFRTHPERPWHVQDVQKRLTIDERSGLRQVLGELVDQGSLIRTRRRTYGLPQEMNLFVGKLQVTSGGYGFVISEETDVKDLFIPAERLAGAWDGDKVVARPNPMKSDDDRASGEIVRVLERGHERVVGTLEYAQGYAILRPDSVRLRERILLVPDSVGALVAGGRLEAGMRIVGTMIWPEASGERDPFAEVTEVLGPADDPEVETRAVIVKYGLKDAFDPETMAEAQAVPPTIDRDAREGRTDYRHVPTFTIDGADAKDFDDALSLERLEGRGKSQLLRVGVHIADVSYYVAEGTSLDKEAVERATSVYLPGLVLPMLPEQLSNGICSLVEGQARLALSALVDLTREGEVKKVAFMETVIESDARLTYEQVQVFSDGGRLPPGKLKLERDVKVLLDLTQTLRAQRIGAGSLDFDFTEAKVDVDERGALHLTPVRSNAARQLVEELMLLANRLVAQEMHKRDIPALYRVHEDPSTEKIQVLQKALQRLGYHVSLDEARPQDLQKVLQQAAGKPEAQLVNTLLLRSLKQARYSSENLGHFGLAFQNYLHFTSPIRRYPDLVVHRVLRAMLQHRLSPTLKERMRHDFPKLAEHASTRERVAEEAERDLTKYFHAVWARDHVGESFTAIVSGVTNFGVFLALPNGVEGLLHVSQLDDDYYLFLEDQLMLMGKHTRKRYRMGDRVEVKILSSTPVNRQIDLLPAHMEMPEVDVDEREPERAPKKLKTPVGATLPVPVAAARPQASAGRGRGTRGGKAQGAPAAPAAAKDAPSKRRGGGRGAAAPAAKAPAAKASGTKSPGAKSPAAKAPATTTPAARSAARPSVEAGAAARPPEARAAAPVGGRSRRGSRRGRGTEGQPAAPVTAAETVRATAASAAAAPSGTKRRRRLVFGDPSPGR